MVTVGQPDIKLGATAAWEGRVRLWERWGTPVATGLGGGGWSLGRVPHGRLRTYAFKAGAPSFPSRGGAMR